MSDFKLYNDLPRVIPSPTVSKQQPADTAGGSFGKMLSEAVHQVNDVEKTSQTELEQFLGSEADLHSVMIALEKADLSFQLMMQVRNKIVQAYQEIMKSQV